MEFELYNIPQQAYKNINMCLAELHKVRLWGTDLYKRCERAFTFLAERRQTIWQLEGRIRNLERQLVTFEKLYEGREFEGKSALVKSAEAGEDVRQWIGTNSLKESDVLRLDDEHTMMETDKLCPKCQDVMFVGEEFYVDDAGTQYTAVKYRCFACGHTQGDSPQVG